MNRHFIEKGMRWQISIWKHVQHHQSLGKCTLKRQWTPETNILFYVNYISKENNNHMTSYYLSIIMTKIKNSDNTKCWQGNKETGSLLHLLEGTENGTITLGNSWAVSYKIEYALTIQPINWAFIPEKWELTCLQKPVCKCS